MSSFFEQFKSKYKPRNSYQFSGSYESYNIMDCCGATFADCLIDKATPSTRGFIISFQGPIKLQSEQPKWVGYVPYDSARNMLSDGAVVEESHSVTIDDTTVHYNVCYVKD